MLTDLFFVCLCLISLVINKLIKLKMKKFLSLAMVAGLFAFVACGPSAEEKAKQEAETAAAANAAMNELEATAPATEVAATDSAATAAAPAAAPATEAAHH